MLASISFRNELLIHECIADQNGGGVFLGCDVNGLGFSAGLHACWLMSFAAPTHSRQATQKSMQYESRKKVRSEIAVKTMKLPRLCGWK